MLGASVDIIVKRLFYWHLRIPSYSEAVTKG